MFVKIYKLRFSHILRNAKDEMDYEYEREQDVISVNGPDGRLHHPFDFRLPHFSCINLAGWAFFMLAFQMFSADDFYVGTIQNLNFTPSESTRQ